ncbi:ABC transporter substrate-binding protein [Okibacterium endophyticum]
MLGSPADTLDITGAVTMVPFAIGYNVFDSLVMLRNGEFALQLAESVEPNSDATVWTITIRDKVTFHDGSALTADDVLASLEYVAGTVNYTPSYGDVDFARSTSDGDRAVTLQLTRPRADFMEAVLAHMSPIFPAGKTMDDGIGSGPFSLQSFSADTGAVLIRNDDYWDGAPALQEIDIVPVAENSARLAALTDGQVDYAMGITATGAETLSDRTDLAVADDGAQSSRAFTFTLNTTMAPFDDPEVRAAMKLAVDREQLVDIVFRGKGDVGNDALGKALPGFNENLDQQRYDPVAARKVFTGKGIDELGILVAEVAPGLTDATELLKQQLADVGITVNITETDPATLYTDFEAITQSQMFATYFTNRPVATILPTYTNAESPYNFSGWKDPEYNELLGQGQILVDADQRRAVLDEAQHMFWQSGPEVIWGYQTDLAAHKATLNGVDTSQAVPLFHDAAYTQ